MYKDHHWPAGRKVWGVNIYHLFGKEKTRWCQAFWDDLEFSLDNPPAHALGYPSSQCFPFLCPPERTQPLAPLGHPPKHQLVPASWTCDCQWGVLHMGFQWRQDKAPHFLFLDQLISLFRVSCLVSASQWPQPVCQGGRPTPMRISDSVEKELPFWYLAFDLVRHDDSSNWALSCPLQTLFSQVQIVTCSHSVFLQLWQLWHALHCQKWAGRANPLSVSWGRQILLLLFFSVLHFSVASCNLWQLLRLHLSFDVDMHCTAVEGWEIMQCSARQSAGLPSRPAAAEDPPCTFLLTLLLISGHANLTLRLPIDFLFIPQFRHMASVHSLQEMISLFFSSFKISCEKLMLMFQGQRKSGQVWDY